MRTLETGNLSNLRADDMDSEGSVDAVNHFVLNTLGNSHWKNSLASDQHPCIPAIQDWAKKLHDKRCTWQQLSQQVPVVKALYDAFKETSEGTLLNYFEAKNL